MSQNKESGGLGGFIQKLSPFVPIVGGVVSNILGGINERKARLYNSPAEQVKRLQEAGLPKAAASNIQPGGGVAVTSSMGTENFAGNLNTSITTQVQRKQLEILQQELRTKAAEADIKEGERDNYLNPTGTYTNTNQGLGISQTLAAQANANKQQEIINKWLPIEKQTGIYKQTAEVAHIAQNTKNALIQEGILVQEKALKEIMLKWEDRMSKQRFDLLVKQNTGAKNANEISSIQAEIMRMTKIAQINVAINNAQLSGNQVEASNLNLLLQGLETESAKAYYHVKAKLDNQYVDRPGGFTPKDLMYLNMFQPKGSSDMNLSNIYTTIK